MAVRRDLSNYCMCSWFVYFKFILRITHIENLRGNFIDAQALGTNSLQLYEYKALISRLEIPQKNFIINIYLKVKLK